MSSGKALRTSKTSLTTPALDFVKLKAGISNRLHMSNHRDRLRSDLSLARLYFPILANFDSSGVSCPILTPLRLRNVSKRVKTSSTDWQTGMISDQSSQ